MALQTLAQMWLQTTKAKLLIKSGHQTAPIWQPETPCQIKSFTKQRYNGTTKPAHCKVSALEGLFLVSGQRSWFLFCDTSDFFQLQVI